MYAKKVTTGSTVHFKAPPKGPCKAYTGSSKAAFADGIKFLLLKINISFEINVYLCIFQTLLLFTVNVALVFLKDFLSGLSSKYVYFVQGTYRGGKQTIKFSFIFISTPHYIQINLHISSRHPDLQYGNVLCMSFFAM